MIFEVDLGSTDYIEEHDAVIVGGGAAGLRSAISLAERGISPIILTKTTVDECATAWAQGGLLPWNLPILLKAMHKILSRLDTIAIP